MKYKKTAQFSILLSTLFAAFLSFGNVFALKPLISISSNDISVGVGKSERLSIDATDFYGDITISSTNSSVATAKFVGCESPTSCAVRNRNVTIVVQGISSGTTDATVAFSGMSTSRGIKISETQKINISTRNTDPSLTSLQVSPGSIDFDKNTSEYTVTVEHDVDAIEITAAATYDSTSISGTGRHTLQDYLNTFTVTATSEDGASISYTIKVKRKDNIGRTAASAKKNEEAGPKSNDNNLTDILIPGYEIDFDADTTEYRITVKPDVESLLMRAVASSPKAKVEIEGNDNIEFGENLIKIAVTAENGEIKDYVVRVTRPIGDDAALMTSGSENGNAGVLGATANGKGFNILPIILSVAGVFVAAGAVMTIVFLRKRSDAKHKQFNVMRVNNGFRPGTIR